MTAKYKTAFQNPLAPENLAQAINPWSWWFEGNANQNGNQNGFINITTSYKAKNPKLESRIVNEVAGYGMQLGIIEDLLEVMIGFLPKSQLTPEQQKTIEKFKDMTAKIRAEKDNALLEQYAGGGADRMVEDLQELKRKNPALYENVSARLRSIL